MKEELNFFFNNYRNQKKFDPEKWVDDKCNKNIIHQKKYRYVILMNQKL